MSKTMTLSILTILALAVLSRAVPTAAVEAPIVSANGLKGPCKPITFIFARGSTEPGNIGIVVGPGVSCSLKHHYGSRNVATQGVDYPALIAGNYEPTGCEAEGVANFKIDVRTAARKCPHTKIVAGGFSQGAACLHAAFRELDPETLRRVVGVVTFGDTRNKQDGGRVPNYPPERTRIFCAAGDEVCQGKLKTSAAHRSYYRDTGAAGKFLAERIGAIGKMGGMGRRRGAREEPSC